MKSCHTLNMALPSDGVDIKITRTQWVTFKSKESVVLPNNQKSQQWKNYTSYGTYKAGPYFVVHVQEGRDLLWPGSPMPSYWLRARGVKLGTDLLFIGMVEALVLSPITL